MQQGAFRWASAHRCSHTDIIYSVFTYSPSSVYRYLEERQIQISVDHPQKKDGPIQGNAMKPCQVWNGSRHVWYTPSQVWCLRLMSCTGPRPGIVLPPDLACARTPPDLAWGSSRPSIVLPLLALINSVLLVLKRHLRTWYGLSAPDISPPRTGFCV